MDTEASTKTTPLLSRRDKAIRIRTVAWKLSRRLDEALRDIQVKKLSDIKDIKDHFKELLNLILDIQVIKEKEVLVLIKQRPPGSLPSSPARHVEEIIITKSGSGTKSKPRVKVAWGNELGTSGFDGLIGELDYDNYDSQGITPVTHTEQPMFHTNKYADRESSLDVLQDIFAKTKRHQEENIILREKVSDLEDKLQKMHSNRKYKEIKGINAGKKCISCEKSRQRAERYQAERNNYMYDIERQTQFIQKLENEKESLLKELKDSNFYVTYYQDKCEETNQTMKDLKILYNKKLTAAENTIEDLKQNFENSEHSRLQMENHSLKRTINNLKEAVDEQDEIKKSFEEKLKDALEAIDEYKEEEKRYQKARNEDKIKYANVQSKNEELSVQLESISSEKDELRNQLQKNKHSAEIEKQKSKKQIQDLRNKIKDLKERNARLQDVEGQCSALLKQRDQDSLVKERMQKKKLYKENEALRNEIDRLEEQLTEEKRKEQHYNNEISTLKSERERANQMVQNLEKEIEDINSRYKGQEDIFYAEEKKLKQDIRKLKVQVEDADIKSKQLSKLKTVDFDRNEIDQKNKELVLLRTKFQTVEEKLRFSLEDNTVLQRELDKLKQNLEETKNQLSESEARYIGVGSKSDTEKENVTLRLEVSEAVKDVVRIREQYGDLSKQYEKEKKNSKMKIDSLQQAKHYLEHENSNLKVKLESLQTESNLFKCEQLGKKDSYHEKMEYLLQQKQQLENDKELLRNKVYSLENEKVEIQERLKKLESNMEFFKEMKAENDDLKVSLAGAKRELENMEKKYNIETTIRLSYDEISTKCKDENESLRRERNLAKIDLQKVLRENEELSRNLNTERDIAKADLERKEKEKSELVALFKDKKDKDLQKIQRLEYDIETLKSRFSTEEKTKQYSSYESMQLKHDFEACKLQKKAVEDERDELKKEIIELENQLQSLHSKQFDDSERNKSNSTKQTHDLEERYRNAKTKLHEAERKMQELHDTIEGQKQENRDVTLKNAKLDEEKKELENQLRLSSSHYKEELENKMEELKKLQRRLLSDEEKVMFSKEENVKLQKDNAELKHNLQNISKQLKESENRFRDLAGSIQNAEGLQSRIYTLELEVSELNKRLSVFKDENLTLQKHNKDLKNKIEEKSQQSKTAEERLQEYAAELEGIPSLKRRLENLQTDNADLKKRCRHKDGLLQNADSNAQKMKKDNQQLQTQMISQKQNYDTLNNKLESLKDKNLELEDRLRRRSPVVVADPKNCQNCWKYRNDISDLKREINDLRDRLSEAAGNKLRDNNPNIADLSDMNRPTSLAEKFSSLYTDEYTDAMEVIEDDMDEAACVRVMLQWLQRCYEWCQKLAKEQRDTLINKSIGFMQDYGGQNVVLSDRCLIHVKEFQKKIAVESLVVVGQICHVKSVTQQSLSSENYIVKYIKKCSELCWMMQISDPPLYLNFDVNSGENLNKNDYNVFTKSGSKIDYLVWPVLYLHKTGPMLAKGVAQGK